jgi:hypothetical protein
VLADLAVAAETEPLVGRESTVVEEAGGNSAGILRVALDGPATEL